MRTKLVNGERLNLTPEEESARDAEESAHNSLENVKARLVEAINAKAKAMQDGGVLINGMLVGTDAAARGLLNGARARPKATRKIVTKTGKAILTSTQISAMVDAVDDFIQLVMDRQYDLLDAVAAATTVEEVAAIDPETGWPA